MTLEQFIEPIHNITRIRIVKGKGSRYETSEADVYIKKGIITLSGDNYVNYKDVFNWYVWLLETYGIRVLKIGYDRYSAQYLVDDLKNYGFHTDDADTRTKRNTVFNKTDYQITHLLEYGHASRNGGRVKPSVHIKPVEEKMITELQERIEKAVQQ